MISRPMNPAPGLPWRGHSDATLTPQRYTMESPQAYPAPIIRRKSYGFRPRLLPPVNLVRGGPRLYG